MKKIITIFLLSCSITITAQILDVTKFATSPNMASIQQSTDIPISYFTGTPKIDIPLCDFEVYNHKFPISISYHPAGIRPEQRPSWLGVGWNLNIGGQITRKINGLIDEGKLKWVSMEEYNDSAYMYNYSDLSPSDWNTKSFILNILNSKEHVETLQNNYDLEPDEFKFNFMGYEGSFYLNHQGEWVVKCSSHLVVDSVMLDEVPIEIGNTFYLFTHSKMISGFRITAEDGTRYYFGYTPNSVELTGQFYNQEQTHWNATSWHLTKVEFTNDEKIELTYERGELTNQMWCDILNYTVVQGGNNLGCSVSFEEDSTYLMSGSLTSPVFLTKVEFPLGKIQIESNEVDQLPYQPSKYYTWRKLGYLNPYDFGLLPVNERYRRYQKYYYYLINGVRANDHQINLYNNEPYYKRLNKSRILDNIKIFDSNNELITNISFEYYNRGDITHRPFLKKVSNSFKWIDPYRFEYKNMGDMPDYLSGKIDHWGYYCGRSLNYKYSTGNEYFNSREPNPNTCDYGIIKKIILPTGGYSRYEFEPNDCSASLNNDRSQVCQMDSNRLAGGNRIRRIYTCNSSDSTDEVLEREFLYKKNYVSNSGNSTLSSGVLGGIPVYNFTNYQIRSYKDTLVKCSLNVKFANSSIFSGGDNSQGSQIGYSEVVEKFHDGSFNVYKYSNFDNGYLDEQPCATFYGARTAFAKYSSREQDRGLLLEKSYYGNNFNLIKKVEYSYHLRQYDNQKTVRAIHWNITPSCDPSFPIAEASSYKVFVEMPLLVSSVETNYSDNSITSTTKQYTYNQYDQISQERVQTDINNELFTNYTYLWQYDTSGNCSNYNLISPIKMIQKRQYSPKTSFVLSDKKEYKYEFSNNGRLCLPVQEIRYYNTNNPVDTCFAIYNNYGRLTSLKDGNNEKVFLWGYSGQYLVADIENCSKNEILAKIPNLDQISMCPVFDSNTINNLRQQLPNAQITTYLYKPLIGMIAKINPNGITEFYKYSNVHKVLLNAIFDTEGNPVKVYNYKGLNY